MKILYQQILLLLIACVIFISCDEDGNDFFQAASLQVVHAASGAPPVHVDYLQRDRLNFLINPVLGFGSDDHFTLPANEARNIRFTFAEDTTREAFSKEIILEAGEMATFFLTGDSAQLSGFRIAQTFRNYTDSVFGVSFVHAANDLGEVSVKVIQTDTAGINETLEIVTSLTPETSTAFSQYESTGRIDLYTFQYLNASDSVLASFSIDPLLSRREKVFRNISVPLIGSPDSGDGTSTLKIIQLDNF